MVGRHMRQLLAGVCTGITLLGAMTVMGTYDAKIGDFAQVSAAEKTDAADSGVKSGKTAVQDDADLLSAEEEASILKELDAFSNDTDWNAYALTTNDTDGRSGQKYADAYVDQNAFGKNGVCFLIDMDNREICISTTADAVVVLTDKRVDDILDDSFEYASDKEYAKCFAAMISATQKYYDKGIASGQYTYNKDTGEITAHKVPNRITFLDILIALGIAAAAAGITIAGIAGKYRLKFGTWSYDFKHNSHLDLRRSDDRLVNQFVTHHHIQRDNGGGNGSGRSTTHNSSGGGTHGGGSHSF